MMPGFLFIPTTFLCIIGHHCLPYQLRSEDFDMQSCLIEANAPFPTFNISEMNVIFPHPSMHRRAAVFSVSWLLRTLILLHLLGLFCSCSYYSSGVSLVVRLPEAPEHWQQAFPELDFRILYPINDSGGFAECRVHSHAHVIILCPKVLYLPVLAYPNLPGQSIQLPPAGGVYPLDCDILTETVSLSWHQGAVAEVLFRLWEQGIDCSTINVPRLSEEISARCQGDPWALDLERIRSRLAAEDFCVSDIRLAPSRDLLLQPGTGNWFLESPFRPQLATQVDGTLCLQSVPLGAHILFKNPPAARYFLYIDEDTTLMIRR
jgi:hypothetical protein